MADLSDQIEDNATGPLKAQGDAGSFEQHSLRDQIEADRYLKTLAAQSGTKPPFRLGRIIPGGAV